MYFKQLGDLDSFRSTTLIRANAAAPCKNVDNYPQRNDNYGQSAQKLTNKTKFRMQTYNY